MMEIPKEFITPSTLSTFAGALSVIFVVCNAIKSSTGYMRKWLVLLISTIISFILVSQTTNVSLIDFVFGTFNGCLLYLAALGGNVLINTEQVVIEELIDPEIQGIGNIKRSFFSKWF
jgi:hypothetical protein